MSDAARRDQLIPPVDVLDAEEGAAFERLMAAGFTVGGSVSKMVALGAYVDQHPLLQHLLGAVDHAGDA